MTELVQTDTKTKSRVYFLCDTCKEKNAADTRSWSRQTVRYVLIKVMMNLLT